MPQDPFRAVFDAVPLPMLVVDADVRILEVNATGARQLGLGDGSDVVLRKRGGEALGCIHHFETHRGCGHAEACKDCTVRHAVGESVKGGEVQRKITRMELREAEGTREIHVRVTTSPFEYRGEPCVLLTLEDVSDVIRLQRMLPICAWCKSVRTGEQYWQSVENFFAENLGLSFTHSICEACEKKLFKEG